MSNPRLAIAAIEEVLDYSSLVAHDLANLMPMIEGMKFEELRKDIAANGLKYKIVLYDGQVLDGRNRYRALKANGHSFTSADFETFTGDHASAQAYVFSTNFQRRQMTNKDKEAMIRLVIERYPDESNRGIAKLCGISSHSQVGAVRDRIDNPPEKKQFEKLCEVVSNNLDLLYESATFRTEFKNKFGRDLRDLLGG
jgi:hypothetical protein